VKPEETPHGAVALAFAEAVAKNQYDPAYSMLSETLQTSTSANQIADDYAAMIGWYECPPENLPELEIIKVSDEQSSRLENGMEWVYVSMSNDYYCEAVSVVIAEEQGKKVICEIDWGRP
jgi:hypothetical protein